MATEKGLRPNRRGQSGITGLETAIILIAFVVVAAVFAFTVISAGLFSTQKSQEAIYDALREARSTIEPDGSMILHNSNGNNYVDQIDICLKLALDGEPVDFTPNSGTTSGSNYVIMFYQDKYQYKSDLEWSLTKLGKCDTDNLLELDETFLITIANLESGTVNGLTTDLQHDMGFNIEIKPPDGATLLMERRTPRSLDTVMSVF